MRKGLSKAEYASTVAFSDFCNVPKIIIIQHIFIDKNQVIYTKQLFINYNTFIVFMYVIDIRNIYFLLYKIYSLILPIPKQLIIFANEQ